MLSLLLKPLYAEHIGEILSGNSSPAPHPKCSPRDEPARRALGSLPREPGLLQLCVWHLCIRLVCSLTCLLPNLAAQARSRRSSSSIRR